MRTLESFDFIVVGGGVIGLSIARAILDKQPKTSILVLEKEGRIGMHASGRNSGVVHAGVYYSPNSLKARLCVEGATLIREYCEERSLPFQEVGKVMVPTEGSHESSLQKIVDNAEANGVPLEVLDYDDLVKIEPLISRKVKKGLYTPKTAILDPKEVIDSLQKELTEGGVKFLFGEEVKHISTGKKQLATSNACFKYGYLVNAAGTHADRIAHKMECGLDYGILPFKGIYYRLAPNSGLRINGNIYPIPDLRAPFLGVHFTRSIHGHVFVGPTAIPALGRENYESFQGFDFEDSAQVVGALALQIVQNKDGFRHLMRREISKFTKQGFYEDALKLVPTLERKHLLSCNKVGIRAQLYNKKEKKLEMDFIVENGPSSTHVLNAVSPGFTSSLAFSKYIMEQHIDI